MSQVSYPKFRQVAQHELGPPDHDYQIFSVAYKDLTGDVLGIIDFPPGNLIIDNHQIDSKIFNYYNPFVWTRQCPVIFTGDHNAQVTVAVAQIFLSVVRDKIAICYDHTLIHYPYYLVTLTWDGPKFWSLFLPKMPFIIIEDLPDDPEEGQEEDLEDTDTEDLYT